jgi:cholinesterase
MKLGCGTSSGAIDCMRSKPSEEIMSAFSGIDFGPKVDQKYIYNNNSALLAAGKFIQKPTLIGHTENESDTYRLGGRNTIPTENVNTTARNITAMKETLESILICSISMLAKARTERKVPTWLYSYAGDFPNQQISPNATTGPWHGSEIGLIFGTTSFTRKLPDTPEEAALAKKMREAWTSFAKAPETALDNLKWPRYDPSGMFSSMILSHANYFSSIYCHYPWWQEQQQDRLYVCRKMRCKMQFDEQFH